MRIQTANEQEPLIPVLTELVGGGGAVTVGVVLFF